MMRNVKTFYSHNNKILKVLLPNRCPLCREVIAPSALYCGACAGKMPSSPQRRYAEGGVPCAAPFLYIDEYAGAVKRFKFGKKAFYARALAAKMADAVRYRYEYEKIDGVISVPMHKTSERQRRFNQAELLARECAGMLGLPYWDALEKYRKNQPQHTMKRADRRQNVHGVFRVTDKALVADKTVLLIDDIFTSGNTIAECTRVLKKAGCRSVCAATVCATLM